MRNLIQKILRESLLDEDYPVNWNWEVFNKLKSFNARIKYCQTNLKRLSSGSSRIVYLIDETKVLKIARNKKGLAQNMNEIQWGKDYYYRDILAQVFEHSEDNIFLEMELAKKVKPDDFVRIVGYSLEDIYSYLEYTSSNSNERSFKAKQLGNKLDDMHENQFIHLLNDFFIANKMEMGDLSKLNTYGLVKRNGNDEIVLVDYGLTKDTFSNHYIRK